jgi:hypothetical protein
LRKIEVQEKYLKGKAAKTKLSNLIMLMITREQLEGL